MFPSVFSVLIHPFNSLVAERQRDCRALCANGHTKNPTNDRRRHSSYSRRLSRACVYVATRCRLLLPVHIRFRLESVYTRERQLFHLTNLFIGLIFMLALGTTSAITRTPLFMAHSRNGEQQGLKQRLATQWLMRDAGEQSVPQAPASHLLNRMKQ